MPNKSTTATSSTGSFHTAPEVAADNNLASLHHTASTLFVARTARIFNTTNELLGDIKALLQTLVEEKDKDRQVLKELIEQHARMGEGMKRIAERQKFLEREGLTTASKQAYRESDAAKTDCLDSSQPDFGVTAIDTPDNTQSTEGVMEFEKMDDRRRILDMSDGEIENLWAGMDDLGMDVEFSQTQSQA